jgi:hypothetical protein
MMNVTSDDSTTARYRVHKHSSGTNTAEVGHRTSNKVRLKSSFLVRMQLIRSKNIQNFVNYIIQSLPRYHLFSYLCPPGSSRCPSCTPVTDQGFQSVFLVEMMSNLSIVSFDHPFKIFIGLCLSSLPRIV